MAKLTIPKKKSKRILRPTRPQIDWHDILSKQTKTALVDELVELIEGDDRFARRLVQRFHVGLPSETLIEDTLQAIADATDYDPRQMNRNFDYDYEAYESVQKNLGKLIEAEHLEPAMEMALELMRSGSEQVEMSDEGLMTDDIEECLRVVIKAVKSADLPVGTVKTWVQKMRRADRVGFICDKDLEAEVKAKQ
jgi:hypothetical protein